MGKDEILRTFSHHMHNADIGIIEGNKGLYDGLDLDGSNSNAALATLLDAPVVLVIDARGMTRGIAPLILGYQNFDPDIHIAGVILNQVGGSRHEGKLRAILEHYTDAKVLGAVHKNSDLVIDERHLGLIPSSESTQAEGKITAIADAIKQEVNLDELITLASRTKLSLDKYSFQEQHPPATDIRIGILRDSAFGFYYPGDLHALRMAGAELVFINSLTDTTLPNIDGLFIGGGFPETQMQALEANRSFRESVHNAVEHGLPVYAECGGLMYLARSISWNGNTCQMSNVIPGDIIMCDKPQGRGYIQLRETSAMPWAPAPEHQEDAALINGHEFHYSRLENLDNEPDYAYEVARGYGIDGNHDGIVYKHLLANYAHLRDVDNNHWARRFVEFARSVRDKSPGHNQAHAYAQ
jgi:cobyrinic acid a,c-diamide synthase